MILFLGNIFLYFSRHLIKIKYQITEIINQKKIIVPNLTYYPRAAILPNNSICDGSVAILTPKNGYSINKEDLKYFATEEFKYFYSMFYYYADINQFILIDILKTIQIIAIFYIITKN